METNIIEKSALLCREEKLGITKELLQTLFDYKDGKLYWKIKSRNDRPIGSFAGYIRRNKNALPRYTVKINNQSFIAARLIFCWHHGYFPQTVDHEDRNSLNDRIENLREASSLENSRNKTKSKNKTSQYLGVHLYKGEVAFKLKNGDIKIFAYPRWLACIRINGNLKTLGYFKIENEAALAYNREAVRYFGEFANLNIIQP